jgi:hypothetical protein
MNTPEFKKHVINLLKEENTLNSSLPTETGGVKNPVDTKPELQKYLRTLSTQVSQLENTDGKEIQYVATILKGMIEDIQNGSLSQTLKQVLSVYDNRTKGIKPKA